MPHFFNPFDSDNAMAFFTFQNQLSDAEPLQTLDLEKAGIKEAQLQDLLTRQLQALDLGTKLMVISREYGSWSDSTRRIDVLAIEPTDDGARLVVVELKRTNDGGHAELQALRYAAMLSTHTFDNVLDALCAFRESNNAPTSREQAQADLLSFLGKSSSDAVNFSSMPRIILVAQGFSTEVTTTVMWLLEHTELDISCYTVALYPYGDDGKALHFDLLLPLREQADYLVKVRNKNVAEAQQQKAAAQRQQRTCTILENKGLLKQGDILTLVTLPRSGMVLAENEKRATYVGGGRVCWARDDKEYSLSKLTSLLCSEHGYTDQSIQGPAYWGTTSMSLAEQAKELLKSGLD